MRQRLQPSNEIYLKSPDTLFSLHQWPSPIRSVHAKAYLILKQEERSLPKQIRETKIKQARFLNKGTLSMEFAYIIYSSSMQTCSYCSVNFGLPCLKTMVITLVSPIPWQLPEEFQAPLGFSHNSLSTFSSILSLKCHSELYKWNGFFSSEQVSALYNPHLTLLVLSPSYLSFWRKE